MADSTLPGLPVEVTALGGDEWLYVVDDPDGTPTNAKVRSRNLGSTIVEGTAASLASSNPVLAKGRVGRATDTNQMAYGDGVTAWNSLPKYEPVGSGTVLDIATSTVAQTNITTAPIELTGLSITFTVGTRPVEVELYLPFAYGNTANVAGRASIADASGTEIRSTLVTPSGVNTVDKATVVKERITAAGTYTRRGRFGRNGGSGTFANGIDLAQYTAHIKAVQE